MSRPDVLTLAELEARQDPWPDPEPLGVAGDSLPYPVEALPRQLGAAVREVEAFTKAPTALVANAAISALSLAGQGLVDVQRAERLTGPCGLSLLTIAESGERKTTCDQLFFDPIRGWQMEQLKLAEPALADYRGCLTAWEAEHDGYKNRLRQLTRAGKSTAEARRDVIEHEALKPRPPRVPRILRVDETPESLAYGLAHEWPTCGVITSEGGLITGAHGMGRDSMMRNLSLYNSLWDGSEVPISRRTSESYTVRGARLTVAIQIQEPTLRAFFAQGGELVRGTGFLARFLIAWPSSTQGTRFFNPPPAAWPALDAYHTILRGLLEQSAPVDNSGCLALPTVRLSADAQALWISFHDDIEVELRSEGALFSVRDIAAKAADNVARLACLFYLLDGSPLGEIGCEHVERAGQIVAWYLTEARRLDSALALPPEIRNAQLLNGWLINRCQQTGENRVATRDISRLGPGRTRDQGARDKAIQILEDAGRLRRDDTGRQKAVRLNPRLLQS